MKTLTLYRPSLLENAFHDFDKYMESLFGETPVAPAARVFGKMPSVDIKESDTAYILEAELPGYDEKNISVNIEGRTLTISSQNDVRNDIQSEKQENAAADNAVQTNTAQNENENKYIIRERRFASFSRSFTMPENANLEEIKAVFKNGILTLEVQKRKTAQKRVIQIEKL